MGVARPFRSSVALATPTADQLPLKITIPVATVPELSSAEPLGFGQVWLPDVVIFLVFEVKNFISSLIKKRDQTVDVYGML